jgi:Cd(II)/Pb(II)-responsive transcriptional regulator
MKIGDLARTTATQVDTIRYYEREGLLPGAARTEGNYRIYGDTHVERLSFIRNCRNLDMTLDEIRVLLRFKDAPAENCTTVNTLLDEHIGHVAHRIRELRLLQKQLHALRAQCQFVQEAGHCGILNELAVMPAGSSETRVVHVRGVHKGVG